MREIKFRAWDKDNNEMLYGGFCLIPTTPSWSATEWFTPTLFRESNKRDEQNKRIPTWFDCVVIDFADGKMMSGNYIVMQYTGLKDKNGKEIYEGDIVRSCTEFPLTLNTHPQNLMEVIFDCGYFGVRDLGTKEGRISNICWVNPDDWLHTQVIGNVYENPELLKTESP